MSMANEMFSLAMKRQRDLINEDLIALIEESSMNGKTNCRVDYISDDDNLNNNYDIKRDMMKALVNNSVDNFKELAIKK